MQRSFWRRFHWSSWKAGFDFLNRGQWMLPLEKENHLHAWAWRLAVIKCYTTHANVPPSCLPHPSRAQFQFGSILIFEQNWTADGIQPQASCYLVVGTIDIISDPADLEAVAPGLCKAKIDGGHVFTESTECVVQPISHVDKWGCRRLRLLLPYTCIDATSPDICRYSS